MENLKNQKIEKANSRKIEELKNWKIKISKIEGSKNPKRREGEKSKSRTIKKIEKATTKVEKSINWKMENQKIEKSKIEKWQNWNKLKMGILHIKKVKKWVIGQPEKTKN